MFVSCWSAKGGAGTTVVVASLALTAARNHPLGALVVDLGGDLPAVLGLPEPSGPGIAEWLAAGEGVPADGIARLEHDAGELTLLPRGAGALTSPERAEVLAALLATDGRAVVVDCGTLDPAGARTDGGSVRRVLAGAAGESLLVTRPCYLSLRRALGVIGLRESSGVESAGPGVGAEHSPSAPGLAPSGVVMVAERGRALEARDVSGILGAAVRAEVPCDPSIARAVDAGLLPSRLPRSLARSLEGLV